VILRGPFQPRPFCDSVIIRARNTIRVPNAGLFPSHAAGLGAGDKRHALRTRPQGSPRAVQPRRWVGHLCGVSVPASGAGTGGSSGGSGSSAPGTRTPLFFCLCQSTRKTTAGKGRAGAQGLFSRLLGGKSKQWSSGAWEELPEPLGLPELGAGWESQRRAAVLMLELLESIPRRNHLEGRGRVAPTGGRRARSSSAGLAFRQGPCCAEGRG